MKVVYSVSPTPDICSKKDISTLCEIVEKKETKETKWVNSNAQLINSLIKFGVHLIF